MVLSRQWRLCPDPSTMGLYRLAAKGKTKSHPNLTAKACVLTLKVLLEDSLDMFQRNLFPMVCDTHMDPVLQSPDVNLNTLSNRRVFDRILQEVDDSTHQSLPVSHQGRDRRLHLNMQSDISLFSKNLNQVYSLLNHLAYVYLRYRDMELASLMTIDIKQVIYHGKEKFTGIPCRGHDTGLS